LPLAVASCSRMWTFYFWETHACGLDLAVNSKMKHASV
jgi:hypothetical protein